MISKIVTAKCFARITHRFCSAKTVYQPMIPLVEDYNVIYSMR